MSPEPFCITQDGYTRVGVECGCALLFNRALLIPTLQPCCEAHQLLLQGGGRISYTRVFAEDPDSIEIGTPSRGGTVKVYHSALDVEGFKHKLDGAFQARTYAQKLGAEAPGKEAPGGQS